MTQHKITCDTCGNDLTATSNCEDYRILLKSEPIPSRSGTVTLMAIYPHFDLDMHFCGINCLWILAFALKGCQWAINIIEEKCQRILDNWINSMQDGVCD